MEELEQKLLGWLKELCPDPDTVNDWEGGHAWTAQKAAKKLLSQYCAHSSVEVDRFGSVSGVFRQAEFGQPMVLLDAQPGEKMVLQNLCRGRPLKAGPVLAGVDTGARLFVAGAVIGRAAVGAYDNIVRIGQGLAADRTGTTGKLIHKSLRILIAWYV